MIDIQDLPDFMTSTIRQNYKFWKDAESFKAKKGSKLVPIPQNPEFMFCNIPFLEEHGINTVDDAVDFLNKYGYNETLRLHIRYHGFHFNGSEWKWTHEMYGQGFKIVSYVKDKSTSKGLTGIFTTDEVTKRVYTFYDVSYSGEGLFEIFYEEKKEVPSLGLDPWLTELNNYKFTPESFTFRYDSDYSQLTFGLELEVSSKISRADLQYLVTQVEPIQEPFFYFKHDGSIGKHSGFENYEIVTFPCSYKFLRKNFRILFEKLERLLPDWKDYFITDHRCGLHVHVNRDSFMSDLHQNKFVAVWNQYDSLNTSFIQRLGQREFNQYCKVFHDHVGKTLARRLKYGAYAPGHDEARRASCRQTKNTCEVRIFKGGFDYNHIMYCLETVHAIHAFTDKSPVSIISTRRFIPEFTGWLRDTRKYNRLKEYLEQCA